MGMSMGTMGAQGMQGMQGSPSTSRRMPNLTADPEEFLKDVKGSKGKRGGQDKCLHAHCCLLPQRGAAQSM